ncbi:hypothetical protein SBA1_1160033 [Candidatus Sulfotelmatobacter kueseliae]|uniref:Uncharacterized protein n=1 Tax=Candidatus Sulfotelmatobacter kueseliae TaxID=2042962 RepID=A0A2U3K0X0_9BACT|nr:hypothetical protein SBA1_1160033 [Candidatus Sulfotelmatobacter kueseliae]
MPKRSLHLVCFPPACQRDSCWLAFGPEHLFPAAYGTALFILPCSGCLCRRFLKK